ncbi:MAG: NADH-quinone oxidoreductase subunit H [Candidatus Altiarchaeia archaeon]
MDTNYIVYAVLNTALIILVSPLYMGIVKIIKARAQGRMGPPPFQQYYNLLKLSQKERVYSKKASAITRMTPYVNISLILTASLCVPLAFAPAYSDGIGNIILFLYILALARFFMAIAGLDAGSTFGGMGSSREMSISSVIEPITIIVFAALAYTLGTTDIHRMFQETSQEMTILNPALILISIPLFIVLIVETARVPVDNPETHLELTMIHETMLLEYAGRDLALMELSHAIKQTMLMAIIINILVPWGFATEYTVPAIAAGMVAFLIKGAILASFIGVFESSMAKTRLFGLPNLFIVAFFLSMLTIWLEVFR